MKTLLLLIIGLFYNLYSFAQHLFLDRTSSEHYYAKINVEVKNDAIYSGKGKITLFDRITDQQIQVLTSPQLDFAINKTQVPVNNVISLGKYQSPLIFGDFNFDGEEDIAIRNGSNENYQAAAYNIYLYNRNTNKFVENKEFTKLASNNLGMFSLDKKAKQLTISQKEGCCYYKDLTYQINNVNKLLLVKTLIEDATIGENVTVIIQELINGKMKTNFKTYKIKDYYKQ
jgi:hypothetical protein